MNKIIKKNKVIRINDILINWGKELKRNLKRKNFEDNINLYLIPKEWGDKEEIILDEGTVNEIKKFNNKISKNKGKTLIPSSEFLILKQNDNLENIFIKEIPEIKIVEATYATNKLVLDLENDNYYFYYLDKNENICEGYIEKKLQIEDEFIDSFNNNPINIFISDFLRERKPIESDKLITYKLSYLKFVIKKNDNINNGKNIGIGNSLQENNTNNHLSNKVGVKSKWGTKYGSKNINSKNDDKDKDKEKENEIVECLIYYYYSDLELNELRNKELSDDDKYAEYFPINSQWLTLFKQKCNYDKNKTIIKRKGINQTNYLDKMNFLKGIQFEELKEFEIFSLNLFEIIINKKVQIYKDYELINIETYEILAKFFGEKDKKNINKLNVIKLDDYYILIKYDKQTFEIVKIKNEKERYLIKGIKNIDDTLIKKLLKIGFKDWLKDYNIIIDDLIEEDILEGDTKLGNICCLEKIEKITDNKEINEDGKNNQQIKLINIKNNFKKYNKDMINKKEENNLDKKGEGQNKDNEAKKYIKVNKKKINESFSKRRNYTNKKEFENQIEENEGKEKKYYKPKINNSIKEDQENSDIVMDINERKISGLIGLQNVGATCYMNAALQCLSNIVQLRIYFLNNKLDIKKSKNNSLSSSLLNVFEGLWENNKITYFVPQQFKDTISKMNPLFGGIQANDTKDLILFILETIHNELNKTNQNANVINNFNNKDFNEVFNNFCIYFKNNYNSIISSLFYGMTNSMMTCCSCGVTTHNVQCFSILFFPLEEVRKFKGYPQNLVNIIDCFDYNQKQDCMMGANQIYCNTCHQMANAFTQTQIIISPNILIINLNRGKGLIYDIKISFEEYLEIKNYIYFNESPHFYELIGVVTHLGTSDMGGHFISFCKNSENQKWYKFNDAIVTESSFQEVISFGVPYVLFYRYMIN